MSLDLLGAEQASGGFGDMLGPILKAAGDLAQGGISIHEAEQAKKKAEAEKVRLVAEADAKLRAAITADAAATNAAARAVVSAQLKSPSATADAAVAEAAARTQDRTAAALTPEQNAKRVEAAEAELTKAAAAARLAPKEAFKQALVVAWTATLNKANAGQVLSTSQATAASVSTGGGESFLTRKVLGPVPGWGVVAGGAGLATAIGLLVKKYAG